MQIVMPHQGKQLELFLDADARINIAHGAVRSGKSVGTIWCWLDHILNGPPGDLLMVGKTTGSLVRNVVLPYMLPVLGKTARLFQTPGNQRIEYGNRTIYLAGANDIRAEERIRGMTLAGAYGDELTTWAPGMMEQIDARMSVEGSRFWGTTNPDSPMHPVKRNWIDRADGVHIKEFHFQLADNPFLPPGYIESLRAIHVGLWAKRFIEGQWAIAEGAVWPMFDPENHVKGGILVASGAYIGLDAGFTHPAVAEVLRTDSHGARLVVSAERSWREATEHQIARELDDWASGMEPVKGIYYDPSAPSLGEQLRLAGRSRLSPADNRVEVGLANVASLLATNRLVIDPSCEDLIQEIPSYRWDPKAQAKGKDKPVKENDDHCDALRYAVQGSETIWRKWIRAEGVVEDFTAPPPPGSPEAYEIERQRRRDERRRKQRRQGLTRVTGSGW